MLHKLNDVETVVYLSNINPRHRTYELEKRFSE